METTCSCGHPWSEHNEHGCTEPHPDPKPGEVYCPCCRSPPYMLKVGSRVISEDGKDVGTVILGIRWNSGGIGIYDRNITLETEIPCPVCGSTNTYIDHGVFKCHGCDHGAKPRQR